MRPYCLAPRVFVCAAAEGAVFLNLRTDAYTGLEAAQARALSLVVEGWPRESEARDCSRDEAVLLAEVLLEQGLLTKSPPGMHPETRPELRVVESELISWECMVSRRGLLSGALRFLTALLTVLFLLRFRPFIAVVDRLSRRRESRRKPDAPFNLETARSLVSAYYHIRPFFYGQKSRCLLDSLTLIEFLAGYGLYPTWVIGVQINPFGSHSWVQFESYVLNGTPAYVRSYVPILAV